jgi:nucleotide-binding universal stress UspA family protein
MSDKIVVGTDGSDSAAKAVSEAIRVAKALGGELHVVSAFELVVGAHAGGAPTSDTPALEPVTDSRLDEILDEASASARLSDVEVSVHGVHGHAADALLEVAGQVGATLIVVGNQGIHSAKRFVLGTVATKVAHRARCNVLIVATEGPDD